MAGIEKVCEFSAEYPGGDMYAYKRNSIQIMPKYRKLFRNAEAYLEISKVEKRILFKTGGSMDYDPGDEWLTNLIKNTESRVLNEYTYTLVVKDPALQGKVAGKYLNWTFDLKDTIKRLKRMLRCRNLKVKYNTKETK